MSDASQKGGAMQSFYHQQKVRESGVQRVDKSAVLDAVKRASQYKGDGRNKPMQNVLGPDKAINPNKKGY